MAVSQRFVWLGLNLRKAVKAALGTGKCRAVSEQRYGIGQGLEVQLGFCFFSLCGPCGSCFLWRIWGVSMLCSVLVTIRIWVERGHMIGASSLSLSLPPPPSFSSKIEGIGHQDSLGSKYMLGTTGLWVSRQISSALHLRSL